MTTAEGEAVIRSQAETLGVSQAVLAGGMFESVDVSALPGVEAAELGQLTREQGGA